MAVYNKPPPQQNHSGQPHTEPLYGGMQQMTGLTDAILKLLPLPCFRLQIAKCLQ